ncbi:hypothetical protein [Nonlabens ponticola]|uniref:Calx-beta domain-containing protein n=1 Tax=Nonlabens ponticola TaxID=2496866 RepID=A0A3S9MXU8_9FLAO|nr:hypothetical protein [Nonlabens ponticola]AZQ43959.1 hypothetical protein EJ995_06825 [Nonlabens ponticola]
MKAIKIRSFLLLAFCCAAILSCEEDDNGRSFDASQTQFVRFFLQVDSDNNPITAPQIELGSSAVSVFDKSDRFSLKVPVALTSAPLDELVTVNYEVSDNDIDEYTITPDQLTFQGTQLVDTLLIQINERWDADDEPSIVLQLTQASDPNIEIGAPNPDRTNDVLTINLEEVEQVYRISSDSRVEIGSEAGDESIITIEFPNGFLQEDVEDFDPFETQDSNFNFEIEALPVTSENQIQYIFRTLEDFDIDEQTYRANLNLNELSDYEVIGNPGVTLIRGPLSDRDITLNTASQFYDTNDQFYRVYGVHWFDFNQDGECEWNDYNTFTQPVVVDRDDPNAVLGDDNGTADTSDDIYYHAFRVGFKTFLEGRTTNPFNLRRWFTNEGTDEDTSPGLNIVPALEFFPTDGTSSTQGIVLVIDQTIEIGNDSGSELIQISGSGTYNEISPGVFELDFALNATNQQLFGGTRTDEYRLYNIRDFEEPALLTIDCKIPIAL